MFHLWFPGQGIWINKTKVSMSISPTTPNLLIFMFCLMQWNQQWTLMTKPRSSAYKPHCCLCPSPDDLPKAALQLFHQDLLYVLTNSANMAPLSICRFLAQDLPSLFQSSPHRYSDRTLQLPEDILIVLPSAFALVYLKGFPPPPSVNSYASGSAQVSLPEGSLPWSSHTHTLSKIYALSSVVSKIYYHSTYKAHFNFPFNFTA